MPIGMGDPESYVDEYADYLNGNIWTVKNLRSGLVVSGICADSEGRRHQLFHRGLPISKNIRLAIAAAFIVGAFFIREHIRSEYSIDPWENTYLCAVAVVSGIIAAWIIVKRD